MKKLYFFFLLFLIGVRLSLGQPGDTSAVKKKTGQTVQKKTLNKKAKNTLPKLKGFIDKNSNGIDDRLENRRLKGQKQRGKYKDRFIDLDGDGICDGRESAIGLRKMHRLRRGKMKGK